MDGLLSRPKVNLKIYSVSTLLTDKDVRDTDGLFWIPIFVLLVLQSIIITVVNTKYIQKFINTQIDNLGHPQQSTEIAEWCIIEKDANTQSIEVFDKWIVIIWNIGKHDGDDNGSRNEDPPKC